MVGWNVHSVQLFVPFRAAACFEVASNSDIITFYGSGLRRVPTSTISPVMADERGEGEGKATISARRIGTSTTRVGCAQPSFTHCRVRLPGISDVTSASSFEFRIRLVEFFVLESLRLPSDKLPLSIVYLVLDVGQSTTPFLLEVDISLSHTKPLFSEATERGFQSRPKSALLE